MSHVVSYAILIIGSYAAFGPTITSANASVDMENPYNVIGGRQEISGTWGKENNNGYGIPPPPVDAESANGIVEEDDPYETIEELTSKLKPFTTPLYNNEQHGSCKFAGCM